MIPRLSKANKFSGSTAIDEILVALIKNFERLLYKNGGTGCEPTPPFLLYYCPTISCIKAQYFNFRNERLLERN